MNDPDLPTAFLFELRLSGSDRAVASFQEVTGLDAHLSEEVISEGGEHRFVHQVPGVVRHEALVCKRGVIGSASGALGQWLRDTLEANLSPGIVPRDLRLSLVGPGAVETAAWDITGAWPVRWEVAEFDAAGDALAVEMLEFAYQTLVRVPVAESQ